MPTDEASRSAAICASKQFFDLWKSLEQCGGPRMIPPSPKIIQLQEVLDQLARGRIPQRRTCFPQNSPSLIFAEQGRGCQTRRKPLFDFSIDRVSFAVFIQLGEPEFAVFDGVGVVEYPHPLPKIVDEDLIEGGRQRRVLSLQISKSCTDWN